MLQINIERKKKEKRRQDSNELLQNFVAIIALMASRIFIGAYYEQITSLDIFLKDTASAEMFF